MAINSVSGNTPYLPSQVEQPPTTKAQKTNAGKDADGDNDASKVGEVEKKATAQKPATPSATVGNKINTTA